MRKYISPSYKSFELRAEDIMTTSSVFNEEKNEEDNKIDYVVSPEAIFGF